MMAPGCQDDLCPYASRFNVISERCVIDRKRTPILSVSITRGTNRLPYERWCGSY
jgi:hypothetical protein